jgi:hypothetical protein
MKMVVHPAAWRCGTYYKRETITEDSTPGGMEVRYLLPGWDRWYSSNRVCSYYTNGRRREMETPPRTISNIEAWRHIGAVLIDPNK